MLENMWILQIKNTVNTQTKHNSEKNNAKHSTTKLPWFSRLLIHSVRKRGELILQRSWGHTGLNELQVISKMFFSANLLPGAKKTQTFQPIPWLYN